MPFFRLLVVNLLTLVFIPLLTYGEYDDSRRLTQHPYFWGSPDNQRAAEMNRRLQMLRSRHVSADPGYPNPVYTGFNQDPNPSSYYPNQRAPSYDPRAPYPNYSNNPPANRPNQGYPVSPGYNPIYIDQAYNNPGFPPQSYDPNNPIPMEPSFDSAIQVPNSAQPSQSNPSFNPAIPITENSEDVIAPNLNGANMRPVPHGTGINDRSRQAESNGINQWMDRLINGPSYWRRSQTQDRDGPQPVTTTTTPTPPATRPVDINFFNPNFLNPDGSTNHRRAGMRIHPSNDGLPLRDRQGGNTPYDTFISTLTKNFFTDTAPGNTGRSNEGSGVPRPKAGNQVRPVPGQENSQPPMYDKPFVPVPDDFLSTNYSEANNANRTYDPPDSQVEIFRDNKASIEEDLQEPEDTRANTRLRRQADRVGSGSSCNSPSEFPLCQYYPRCFEELNENCRSRDSFIGDDINSICFDLNNLASTTESEVLREFLTGVINCVDEALLEVLEYASCDDVTDRLEHALLIRDEDNCLVKANNYCRLIESPQARYNLARVFAQPRGRQDFMLRLLVSMGNHTTMCHGPGANIFLLDLLSNVMQRNTTYMMPGGQAMPVFEPNARREI